MISPRQLKRLHRQSQVETPCERFMPWLISSTTSAESSTALCFASLCDFIVCLENDRIVYDLVKHSLSPPLVSFPCTM
jgi:hypothetical protein